jgi:hypothetical protein
MQAPGPHLDHQNEQFGPLSPFEASKHCELWLSVNSAQTSVHRNHMRTCRFRTQRSDMGPESWIPQVAPVYRIPPSSEGPGTCLAGQRQEPRTHVASKIWEWEFCKQTFLFPPCSDGASLKTRPHLGRHISLLKGPDGLRKLREMDRAPHSFHRANGQRKRQESLWEHPCPVPTKEQGREKRGLLPDSHETG